MGRTCIVTGLWDLGRDQLGGSFQRSMDDYLKAFRELLTLDVPMHLFLPRALAKEAQALRGDKPTAITRKEVADFESWFPFHDEVQRIRNDPFWLSGAGWLPDSPQAALPDYNPIMMSKPFMVHDACVLDRLGCSHYYWLDGGITRTVGLDRLKAAIPRLAAFGGDRLLFVSYPYESATEVHGFPAKRFNKLCGVEQTKYVCRGGFFGGPVERLHRFNAIYYELLRQTLEAGDMGADENLFTAFCHLHPDEVIRGVLTAEDHGLLGSFFEHVVQAPPIATVSADRQNLYVLTFNHPRQLRLLLESFKAACPDLFTKPHKVLIDNSTDPDAAYENAKLCSNYGDWEIAARPGNIGVCGGRQLAAEHFGASNQQQYLYFEDDMLLHQSGAGVDDFGLGYYVPDLYRKSLLLFQRSGLDYLKLSFQEFYGSNDEQWSWTNIPQELRTALFPANDKVDPGKVRSQCPRTALTAVMRYPAVQGLSYLTGQFHVDNWPAWWGREGNRKVYLDVTWQSPREQAWMSRAFQLQLDGSLSGGCLLASPINHRRECHYPADQRRES